MELVGGFLFLYESICLNNFLLSVSLNSVIAVLDADFHSLPSVHHRQLYGPVSYPKVSHSLSELSGSSRVFLVFMQWLDRIKCRLLEGTNTQDLRALVLDMQARLLLNMLGKGIEAALVNPATLLAEPWQASGETLAGIEADKMVVEPALVPSIQVWPCKISLLWFQIKYFANFIFLQPYVDAVLDLASHFITRLRRYASFCRTLATHAVTSANASGARNPASNSASLATTTQSSNQGHRN